MLARDLLRIRSRLALVATAALTLLAPAPAFGTPAQADRAMGDSSLLVRGVVRAPDGSPIDGANVFLLETLDGALKNVQGEFAIRTAHRGAATLLVRRLGFRPLARLLSLPHAEPLELSLRADAVPLAAVVSEAGRWTAGNEPGATLGALDVVSTPGTAANVNRAIQTLPGTQSVDEGTALFVRGGDYLETKVLLDGAVLLGTPQLRTPTGTFTGTVDPFLLDAIFFSSGGFGARYGNALSGIVSLRTAERPARTTGTLSAGLAAVSGSLALDLPGALGVRAAANRHDLQPFLRVNGSSFRYDPPPRGHDVSGSIAWNHRPAGEIKLFAVHQRTRLGLGVDEASHEGRFDVGVRNALAVVSWQDLIGPVAVSGSVSRSMLDEEQVFGAFDITTHIRSTQANGMLEWEPVSALELRAGGELERSGSAFAGSIPERGDDVGEAAPRSPIGNDAVDERRAAFGEAQWRPVSTLSITAGARTDRSKLTRRSTVDPRLSVSLVLHPMLTFTGAWGIYHQVPDALMFDETIGDPSLPPMRARQAVLGAQIDARLVSARLEAYHKHYRDLAQFDRDHRVHAGGAGASRGIDVWVKGRTPIGVDARVAYSLVSARRTDPGTGLITRASFDVTHSLTAVLERRLGPVMTSAAYRHATGRPFTPVTSASHDPARDVWVPVYGASMSERLPTYRRVDLSAAHMRSIGSAQLVLFWSMSNLLDHRNVHAYRYTQDYSHRVPVRSMFERSHYFGGSLTFAP